MEIDNIGQHCAVKSCNRKDFLPFSCDTCKNYYCLDHRTYQSHECIGGISKDMTSLDCPICHKSIKYNRSQDINILWNKHYLNECQTNVSDNGQIKKTKRCLEPSCKTILGPSNTFKCPKCLLDICLSHRLPEDHHCVSLTRNKPQQLALKKKEVISISQPTSSDTTTTQNQTSKDPLKNETFLSKFDNSNSNNKKPSKPTSKSPSNIKQQSSIAQTRTTQNNQTSSNGTEVRFLMNILIILLFLIVFKLDLSNVFRKV